MDERQKNALEICRIDLIESLDTGIIIILRKLSVLTAADYEILNKETTTIQEKRIQLLEQLKIRDGAWEALIESLKQLKQAWLAEKLLCSESSFSGISGKKK